ncbi:MAG: hypothetical protein J6Z50_02035 [Fibrobacterales bacterium]|nr:hypothetical protein [Fibrobacterales bacterium]MBP5187887.1 hypothetical protein [Fibrobacterales bacterium]
MVKRFSIVALSFIAVLALAFIAVLSLTQTDSGPQGPVSGSGISRNAAAEHVDGYRLPYNLPLPYNPNAEIISCHGDLGLTVNPGSALAEWSVFQSAQARKPEIARLYQRHLSKLPPGVPFFDGQLSIDVKIGEDGIVSRAMIGSSETGNDAFDREIRQSIESWTFPPSSGISLARLTWRFHCPTFWVPGGAAS